MKKLFALMLALCMMCGCAALAENAVTWDMVASDIEASGISGDFVTFDEIAVKIWLPEGLTAVNADELPEGFIGYFQAEDGSAISVAYVDVNGMDLDTYAQLAAENGATGIEAGTVNGLPCVSYELGENLCTAFTTEAGYILEVAMGPVKSDDDKLGASYIMASIQAAE